MTTCSLRSRRVLTLIEFSVVTSVVGILIGRLLPSAEERTRDPRLVVNPSRPVRLELRVRTRRPKGFPVMKKPRQDRRKEVAERDIAT